MERQKVRWAPEDHSLSKRQSWDSNSWPLLPTQMVPEYNGSIYVSVSFLTVWWFEHDMYPVETVLWVCNFDPFPGWRQGAQLPLMTSGCISKHSSWSVPGSQEEQPTLNGVLCGEAMTGRCRKHILNVMVSSTCGGFLVCNPITSGGASTLGSETQDIVHCENTSLLPHWVPMFFLIWRLHEKKRKFTCNIPSCINCIGASITQKEKMEVLCLNKTDFVNGLLSPHTMYTTVLLTRMPPDWRIISLPSLCILYLISMPPTTCQAL